MAIKDHPEATVYYGWFTANNLSSGFMNMAPKLHKKRFYISPKIYGFQYIENELWPLQRSDSTG